MRRTSKAKTSPSHLCLHAQEDQLVLSCVRCARSVQQAPCSCLYLGGCLLTPFVRLYRQASYHVLSYDEHKTFTTFTYDESASIAIYTGTLTL